LRNSRLREKIKSKRKKTTGARPLLSYIHVPNHLEEDYALFPASLLKVVFECYEESYAPLKERGSFSFVGSCVANTNNFFGFFKYF